MTPEPPVLMAALAAVLLLIGLVTWARVNPFLALILAGLAAGFGAGMPAAGIAKSMQEGMGATLGGVAAVLALGVMLGKLLAESGGAEVLARRFSSTFGPDRAVLCIMALALTVGLVTWFAVAFLLLAPVLFTLARETRKPYLELAIPLLACISVMHGVMPPHPGPVVAIELLKADTGQVLLWGMVIGLPTAAVAGPLFARLVCRSIVATPPPEVTAVPQRNPGFVAPGFGITLFTIVLPVALMLLATAAALILPKEAALRELVAAGGPGAAAAGQRLALLTAATFIGHPVIALVVAVLTASWTLGLRCGYRAREVLAFTEQSVATIGMALLIVGGAGGFARVLKDGGAAQAMADLAQAANLPPLVYGWLIAAIIRVATGSATVGLTTAAGLVAPLVLADPSIHRPLMVVSIGCGSLFLSHLNDGGFWIVKNSLGLTVSQTFKTWSMCETIIGIAGLLFTLAVDAALRGFA